MTFETLAYIHRLLEQENAIAGRNLATRSKIINDLYKENAPEEAIEEAKLFKEIAIRHSNEASQALTDFESHDWR